jgi:hypothetical protein
VTERALIPVELLGPDAEAHHLAPINHAHTLGATPTLPPRQPDVTVLCTHLGRVARRGQTWRRMTC